MHKNSIELKGFSHAAMGVHDYSKQRDFYINNLGLKAVAETPQHIYLRAARKHHHVLELIKNHDGLHHIAFEVKDDEEIERAKYILEERGIEILQQPRQETEPGVNRLLRFNDPEGNTIELVSNVQEHSEDYSGKFGKPLSLNHVTFFTGNIKKQEMFYCELLGMHVRDRVPNFLTFLTSTSNHHSLGFITLPNRGFQHIAFDYSCRTDMLDAMVKLSDAGYKRIGGPGRHGPGHSLYTYFEDNEKNLIELTAEIELLEEPISKPGVWTPKEAINLWRIGKPMGPPAGLWWVTSLLPYISKLTKRG